MNFLIVIFFKKKGLHIGWLPIIPNGQANTTHDANSLILDTNNYH